MRGLLALLIVVTLVAAACGTTRSDALGGPSALRDMDSDELPEPLVDPRQVIAGGPPPDGIPPIDQPAFIAVAEVADRYRDEAPVIALEINGDARAYPVAVLIWHEIVNDTVGGVPVAITYCPLCNSAVTYGRVVDGHETTFGTSGLLFGSALIMYDRATESLWTHFDGRAIAGILTGHHLDVHVSPLLAWSDFARTYPDGLVLDETMTGHRRDYGANPYVGYDDPETHPFLFFDDVDIRAPAKERVVGISHGGVDVAYSLRSLMGEGPTATTVAHGDEELVILWEPGQTSALHGPSVQYGREVGSVGVFEATGAGQVVTLTASDGGFTDAESGSTWSITGLAIAGPLEGTQLPRIAHLDTFWFAWSTYRPGTELVGAVG